MHKQLTKETRIALAALLRVEHTPKECARELGFNKSSITREIALNRDDDKVYRGASAHKAYLLRRKGAKRTSRKIGNSKKMQKHIKKRLAKRDSPEQIAGRLKQQRSSDSVCHETIYRWIFQEQPLLKKHLRRIGRKGKYRRKRGTKKPRHGGIRVCIARLFQSPQFAFYESGGSCFLFFMRACKAWQTRPNANRSGQMMRPFQDATNHHGTNPAATASNTCQDLVATLNATATKKNERITINSFDKAFSLIPF